MKKLIALTLTIVMTASMLAGCGAKIEPAPQTEPVSETTEAAETVPATEPEAEAAVPQSDVNMQSCVSLREEGDIPGSIEAHYRLPKLDLETPAAQEFAEWVDDVFGRWESTLEWNAENNQCYLDYKVGIYYDILCVEFMIGPKDAIYTPFGAFSIDLHTNDKLTVEAMLDRAGATREQLEDHIRKEIKKQIFDWEDEYAGQIQGVAAYREKMLTSENLQDLTVQVLASLNGSFQIGVNGTYYVEKGNGAAVAKEALPPRICYAYVNDFLDLCDEPEVLDAGKWIADGETGTVKAQFPADYRLPKLIADQIDRDAFDKWVQDYLDSWKEAVMFRWPESADIIENNGMHLSYNAFVVGDVLSVMFISGDDINQDVSDRMPSISFDLNTGKKLELSDILEKTGMSLETVYSSIEAGMQTRWHQEAVYLKNLVGGEEAQQATLTRENLAQTQIVLWPGAPYDYRSGQVTLFVWEPYTVKWNDDVSTAVPGGGSWARNIVVPGLNIR